MLKLFVYNDLLGYNDKNALSLVFIPHSSHNFFGQREIDIADTKLSVNLLAETIESARCNIYLIKVLIVVSRVHVSNMKSRN